jgi:hypothetical protein
VKLLSLNVEHFRSIRKAAIEFSGGNAHHGDTENTEEARRNPERVFSALPLCSQCLRGESIAASEFGRAGGPKGRPPAIGGPGQGGAPWARLPYRLVGRRPMRTVPEARK